MNGNIKTWIGWLVTGFTALTLLGAAFAQFSHLSMLMNAETHLGVPNSAIVPMGALLLAMFVLYMVPRTMVLGTVLMTAYYGYGMALHINAGKPVLPVLMLAMLAWAGTYFRLPALRRLLPFQVDDHSFAARHQR